MKEVSIIGLDLAKNSFQPHGASADGAVVFRKKVSRSQLIKFLTAHPRCIVAMEACASAHHWGRAFGELGHDVRLIAPIYVKPFVKRQKNDAADAEAICEAAQRPYASAADCLPMPFEQADSVRLDIGGREPHGIRIENFTSAIERRV